MFPIFYKYSTSSNKRKTETETNLHVERWIQCFIIIDMLDLFSLDYYYYRRYGTIFTSNRSILCGLRHEYSIVLSLMETFILSTNWLEHCMYLVYRLYYIGTTTTTTTTTTITQAWSRNLCSIYMVTWLLTIDTECWINSRILDPLYCGYCHPDNILYMFSLFANEGDSETKSLSFYSTIIVWSTNLYITPTYECGLYNCNIMFVDIRIDTSTIFVSTFIGSKQG